MDKSQSAQSHSPGYETRDANVRGVLDFLVILGVVIVIVAVLCWGMFRYFTTHSVETPATQSPFADARQLPLGPQLQVNPRQDWLKYREDQRRALETYAWENRSAGTVRIPIKEAMELLVKKGVPVQGQPQPADAQQQKAPEGKAKTKP